MIACTRLDGPAMPANVVAECEIVDPAAIESLARTLPDAERRLAAEFHAPARRTGFLAGRLALHAALEEAGFRAAAEPILRDERGRPVAAFAGAPAISIAHSRRRAIAIVAMPGSCAAIGIDVEEVDGRRAEALVRMAISADERRLVKAADPALVEGPLALWCARESCVKAHALEVGWFGTALVARAFGPCTPFAEGAGGHWRLELALEGRAPMTALAWRRDSAVYGAAVSA